MDVFTLTARIDLDTSEYTDALGRASQQTSTFGDVLKANLASDLIMSGISRISDALGSFTSSIVTTGMDYESTMSQVQAISGASAEEMVKLGDKAKEVGATTKFSAAESAEALTYMAMAGWKTNDMVDGLEGIMNLAAASGEDLATTSDIVTDALTAFGLKASDSGHFADVLAMASSNANTNVSMMGETFKYAAPLAGAMGFSVEDTAVAIGLMANAGIKGSQAGTSLRSIFTRLSDTSGEAGKTLDSLGVSITKDTGEMKSLSEIMTDLRKKLNPASDEFVNLSEAELAVAAKAIAGQEAMSGFLAIVNASDDDFNKLTEAIKNADGATQNMADTMMQNLQGSLDLAKSALDGVAIEIFERVEPALENMVNFFTNNVVPAIGGFFNFLIDNKEAVIGAFVGIAAGVTALQIGPTVASAAKAFGGMVSSIHSVGDAISLVKGGISSFFGLIEAHPFGLAAVAVGGLVTVLTTLALTMGDNKTKAQEMAEAWHEMGEESRKAAEADIAQIDHAAALAKEFEALTASGRELTEEEKKRRDVLYEEINSIMPGLIEKIGDGEEAEYRFADSIEHTTEKMRAQAILQAYQDDLTEAIKNQSEAMKAQQDISDRLAQKYADLDDVQRQIKEGVGLLAEGYYEVENGIRDEIEALETEYRQYQDNIDEQDVFISNFENLKSVVDDASASSDELNTAMSNLGYGMKSAADMTRDELNKAIEEADEHIKTYKTALENAHLEEGVRKNMEDSLAMWESRKGTLEQAAANTGTGMTNALSTALAPMPGVTASIASNAMDSFNSSVNAKISTVLNTASKFGDAFTSKVKSLMGIHSPSTVFREIGENVVEGFSLGVSDDQKAVNSATALAQNVGNATDRTINASLAGIKSMLSTQIQGMTAIGTQSGAYYASGVSSSASSAATAGQNLASLALQGAGSQMSAFSAIGQNVGSAFSQGLLGMVSSVQSAAQKLASAAKSAVSASLSIHSPSKWAIGIGEYVGEGLAIGLSDVSGVERAAEGMADSLMGAVNGALGSASAPDFGLLNAGYGGLATKSLIGDRNGAGSANETAFTERLMASIADALRGMTLEVNIGGEQIEGVVSRAIDRRNYRSGGR